VGVLGGAPAQLVGPGGQLRRRPARGGAGGQRPGLPVSLHQAADEGRADREALGGLGRRLPGLTGFKDPYPQGHPERRHIATRRASRQGAGRTTTQNKRPLRKLEARSNLVARRRSPARQNKEIVACPSRAAAPSVCPWPCSSSPPRPTRSRPRTSWTPRS